MCSQHVSGRWFDKHKGLLVDTSQANKKRISADFVKLNNVTLYLLNTTHVAFDLMIQKWEGCVPIFSPHGCAR